MAAPVSGTLAYAVTAQKATSVRHSVVCHFTGPDDVNLVLAKSTRLEVHKLTPDGLQSLLEVPIYGRISSLQVFRPPGEELDMLFVLTERNKFVLLRYDPATGQLTTRANGDVQDRIGRPTEAGQLCVMDPEYRLIGLHLYQGALKIIPVDGKGMLREAFDIRLEELQVIDVAFLHGTPRPTLAVLYEDTREARHLKTYEVLLKDKDFGDGPWQQANLDVGASLLVPLPAPLGGVIVVGENTIAYVNGNVMKATTIRQTIAKAVCRIDPDGSRHLLCDVAGVLYVLALEHSGFAVSAVRLEALGEVSIASTLAYLDSGLVYIGSASGNSQLVRLQPVPDAAGSFVEILESFPGLGPIVDLTVMDLERQGQGQLVTCSGMGKDGSLRIVRNGVGINEQATVELPGIKGIWSLRAQGGDAHDTYLVVTFISETRVLAISSEDELDETDVPGFDCAAQTLLCLNAGHDQLVQVTPAEVRLVACGSRQLITSWTAAGGTITIASGTPSQLVMGLSGGRLVYLEVGAGSLTEVSQQQLAQEVSCVDCQPLGPSADRASLAAVGLWDRTIALFSLPRLERVSEERLAGESIPRSVLLCCFEGDAYLLAGLGDGALCTYSLDAGTGALSGAKKLLLGTQPIGLRAFRSGGATHAFAASDRPTVIYSLNHKLLFSHVNLKEAGHACSFNSASFPDALAVASDETLTIGTIDDIQKLHIRTVPLGEQPRRVAHQEGTHTLLVCCIKPLTGPDGPLPDTEGTSSSVRLLDDQTFDTLGSQSLEAQEMVCSCTSLVFAEDPKPYYIVGTAYIAPDEPEATRGRLLVFAVESGQLALVASREVKGAVYNVNPLCGKLLAGVHNRVCVFGWLSSMDGSHELRPECSFCNHILAVNVAVRGDSILVGDVMMSATLLVYKPDESVIEERASDVNSTWTTAVAAVDDDTFLVAESGHNVLLLRRNGEAATDEERHRLEVAGEFHLGQFVNCFRHGSLVMRMPDSELAGVPSLVCGTIDGAIGVVAALPASHFGALTKMQDAMASVVQGVGGLEWAAWRAFSSERRTAPARGFIDGDLIEAFLDLTPDSREEVARRAGLGLAEAAKLVEDVSRLH